MLINVICSLHILHLLKITLFLSFINDALSLSVFAKCTIFLSCIVSKVNHVHHILSNSIHKSFPFPFKYLPDNLCTLSLYNWRCCYHTIYSNFFIYIFHGSFCLSFIPKWSIDPQPTHANPSITVYCSSLHILPTWHVQFTMYYYWMKMCEWKGQM